MESSAEKINSVEANIVETGETSPDWERGAISKSKVSAVMKDVRPLIFGSYYGKTPQQKID